MARVAAEIVLVAISVAVCLATTAFVGAFVAAHGLVPDARNNMIGFIASVTLSAIPGLAIGYGAFPLLSVSLDLQLSSVARRVFWAVSVPLTLAYACLGAAYVHP
jgi:hypothetical protein